MDTYINIIIFISNSFNNSTQNKLQETKKTQTQKQKKNNLFILLGYKRRIIKF